MYHKDGILVHLEAQGKKIKESAYLNGQDPADTNSKDTRARISEEFNTPFTVELELTKDFRPFSAEAIKLTIAIGHSEQTPEDLDDVQAWHIPLDLISMTYNYDAVPNNDWIDTYNAAKGFIAVYVVRGKFTGLTDCERKTFPTDPPETLQAKAEKTIHPIRWEWFQELRPSRASHNGEPYVFEFRNFEELPKFTDHVPMLDGMPSNTEQAGSVNDDTHTTSSGDSGEDDGGEYDSDEHDSDEDDRDEDDSDEDEDDRDDDDDDDDDNSDEDMSDGFERYQRQNASREERMARRDIRRMTLPYYTRPSVKRKRVVHSESRSPSTERPGRPSAEQPGISILTNTNATNNISANVDRTATPTPAHPPNTSPEEPMQPTSRSTPQPMPPGNSLRRPSSEASTSGALHEVHRKRALAVRKLELSRARNRAVELEARNRADEIQQEIDIETEFGDGLGE